MKKFIFVLSLFVFFCANVWGQTQDNELIFNIQNKLTECGKTLNNDKMKCPESWSFKCFDYLISMQHKAQDCYSEAAVEIMKTFYNIDTDSANEKIDKYIKFNYKYYLFIYNDNIYCLKNNCGISPYLYSEYATTKALSNYVSTMLNSILAKQD